MKDTNVCNRDTKILTISIYTKQGNQASKPVTRLESKQDMTQAASRNENIPIVLFGVSVLSTTKPIVQSELTTPTFSGLYYSPHARTQSGKRENTLSPLVAQGFPGRATSQRGMTSSASEHTAPWNLGILYTPYSGCRVQLEYWNGISAFSFTVVLIL